MISLRYDAKNTLKDNIYNDGVRAYYYSVCENYSKGYVQCFITDMQILITKVGKLVSKTSLDSINISFCAQSINYLTGKVLDNPDLRKRFDNIGLNDKGNDGKHDIISNKINMDACVKLYNEMINGLCFKYPQLSDLKSMIVTKKSTKSPKKINNTGEYRKVKNESHPNSKATTNDEKITLKAELERGDGRYIKGIFKKIKMINFHIKINIGNPNNLTIKSVHATFTCGKNIYEQELTNKITSIDLEASKFSGNIEASVVVIYKLGLFKTKQIKTTISKQF